MIKEHAKDVKKEKKKKEKKNQKEKKKQKKEQKKEQKEKKKQNKEETKEKKEQTKEDKPNYKLLITTFTFLFPIFYSYFKGNNVLSIATTLALLGSINYWRNPIPGYRRNIDLITSKISLAAYFIYGYINVIGLYPRLIGYVSLGLLAYLYNNSCKKFYLDDKTWEDYHIYFHLLTTISKMYVIYWI